MSREIARRALSLFEQCLDLPDDELNVFLDEACRGDAVLRKHVESLLSVQDDAESMLPSTDADDQDVTDLGTRPAQVRFGSIAIGATLADRYAIVERIGAGGMGEVYRAVDKRLDRDVAIKTLRLAGLQSPDMHRRFEREVKSVAALAHANIVMLFDVADHGDIMFAVMEYVAGKTLRQLIEEKLSLAKSVAIARDVAQGLAAAHARGTMHRDIKPENVIVAGDGTAKILDFGLARPEVASADQQLTMSSIVPGTAPYMSPEQAAGEPLTCATDVFSFGTMLYEMLAGVNPFRGDNLFQTMQRVVAAEAPSLGMIVPEIPQELSQLVEEMVARSADDRPPASDIHARLRVIEPLVQAADADSGGSTAATKPVKRRNRKWQPSLIVLPFQVFSADDRLESIADGLVEELTTTLTRVPFLSVTSRMSSFALKGQPVTADDVRRRFRVEYMIEGSIQRQGDQLRANVQLIETDDSFHAWAQTFDAPESENPIARLLADIIARLEPQLVRAILGNLRDLDGELDGRQLLVQAMCVLAMKGWHRDSFREVAELLRKSVAMEPDLALAHAHLALNRGLGKRVGLVDNPEEAAREALHHAEIALELADLDSNVLGLAGCAISDIGHAERAIPILNQAIDLNPNNPQAHAALGAAFLMLKDPQSAICPLQRGIEISPFDARLAIWGALLAVAHLLMGDPDAAVQSAELGCQSDRKSYIPRVVLTAVRIARGELPQAETALREAIRVKPDLTHDEVSFLVGRELGIAFRKLRKECETQA